MGLLDFAQQKLSDHLDKKMQIREDASKLYQYISDHAEEIVAEVRRLPGKLINPNEVGIESKAKDVVEEISRSWHDDKGPYVDVAGKYRVYVKYVEHLDLFKIPRYTVRDGYGTNVDSQGGNDYDDDYASGNDYDDDNGNDYDNNPVDVNSLTDTSQSIQKLGSIELPKETEEQRLAREERKRKRREREEQRKEEKRKEKEELKKKVDEINNAPMPEAKDIVLEIKTCEQKSDNYSLSLEEQKAYEGRAKLLKEYAKQKYANDPAVKPYLRKDTLHNKRFLIMWCVFLVLAIIVFAICEEWYHYVFAVLGTIVVAVVLAFVHINFSD